MELAVYIPEQEVVFKIQQLGVIDLAGVVGAHGLGNAGEAHLTAIHSAGQHGAAADKNRGHVEPGRSHEQAGDVFIAVGHHHQGVQGVGHSHSLGGVGNEIPGDQGVFHALMAHSQAVAHRDSRKHNGGAAGHGNAGFHSLHDFIQVHVAGNNVILGADHADQRTLQFLFGKSQGVEQGAVGGALHAFGHCIASQGKASF